LEVSVKGRRVKGSVHMVIDRPAVGLVTAWPSERWAGLGRSPHGHHLVGGLAL